MPNDTSDLRYLSQMHHLRYKVFHKKLRWKDGLRLHSLMEFDEYDHSDARYLVRINKFDCVDACARLTPTNRPNLLCCHFSDFVESCPLPTSPRIFEVSRFCADIGHPDRDIAGQLMAGMLEYGLLNNIDRYVSLSDHKMIPIVKRFGWEANPLGPYRDTGTDLSVALSYDVNRGFYDAVLRKLSSSVSMMVERYSSDRPYLQVASA